MQCRDVDFLAAGRLLHFKFDAADPACDKIVDVGADNTEDEPHHAVDDRHEETHPEHDSRHKCGGGRRKSLGGPPLLRPRPPPPAPPEKLEGKQTPAPTKNI